MRDCAFTLAERLAYGSHSSRRCAGSEGLSMAVRQHEPVVASRPTLIRKLDAAAWGLFFIWIGVAWLANVGWGVGLLGVGIITLAGQGARKFLALEVEGFGLVVGLLFALGGIWELFSIRVDFVPVLAIVAGALLLVSALTGRSTRA